MTWATEQREHWIKKYFPYTGDSRDLSDTRSYINTQDQLKKEYAGRVLLELLQNVDDAANKAALNKVIRTEWVTEFVLDKDSLKVMNHGTTFTGDTLMRLCNGADSDKAEDEETTGAKGIGFRGVLNWSDDIRIYSGDFAVSFSKFGVHKVLDTLNKNNNVIFKTLTDTNPHILELISPLSVPFDVDTDKIPPQWSNKKYNKTYDTCIELRLTPDKIQKVKNAFKTFETDEIYSMLFMRRINKVILTDNTGDMSHTIVISTTENNNIKTITIEKTNGDTTHDKFYFFKYNKYNSIAVPCNWDKNKTYTLYNTFPITDKKLPLPVLMNSTQFQLTQNRDSFTADTTTNQELLADLLNHLLNIAVTHFTNHDNNKNWGIELFTFNSELAENLRFWEDAVARANLQQKLSEAKIIPSMDGKKLFSYKDKPEFFTDTEPNLAHLKELVKSEYIEEQTANALKESILGKDLSKISEKDLCNFINSHSSEWDTQQRIDVFIFWTNNYHGFTTMPKLLKTQQGTFFELSKGNSLVLYSGDTIGKIPDWAEAQMDLINSKDRDYLFKITPVYNANEKNKERDVAEYYNYHTATEIFSHTEKNNLVTKINKLVRGNHKYATEFLMYAYNEYKDKGNNDLRADFSDLYLPGLDGQLYKANQLYFGDKYFPDDKFGDTIWTAAGYKILATPTQLNLSPNQIEDFVRVIQSIFRVHGKAIPETKQVTNLDAGYRDHLIQKIKDYYGYNRTCNIENVTLQTIDNLDQILKTAPKETLISWLDSIAPQIIKAPQGATITYLWGSSKPGPVTLPVDSYIIYQILNTKWVWFAGTQRKASDCILNSQRWPELIPQLPHIPALWKDVETKNNPAELPIDDFYGILLALPDLNNGGKISTEIYNFIAQKPDKISHLSVSDYNKNKQEFLTSGKLWASRKTPNHEQFFDRTQVYFHSGKPINVNNHPILVTPLRQGQHEIFKKIFGIEQLNEKLTYQADELHYDNAEFEKNFNIFKKYLLCFGTSNLHKVANNISIQIAQKAHEIQTNELLSVKNYTVAACKDAHKYLIYLNRQTTSDKKYIAEALTDIISREAASNISPSLIFNLWSTDDTERASLLLREGYSIEKLNDLIDNRQLFIKRLGEVNKNDFDCTEFINRINFDTFDSIDNAPHIKDVLIKIGVDIDEFNDTNIQVNLRPYNRRLLTQYANSIKNQFSALKYNEYITADINTQSGFYKDVISPFINIEDIADDEIANSIYFDVTDWIKKYFNLSDDFMNELNSTIKTSINISDLTNSKKEEFYRIADDLDRSIIDETLTNMKNQSLLLFGHFDTLKQQCVQKAIHIQQQQQKNNTVLTTPLVLVSDTQVTVASLKNGTTHTHRHTRNNGGSYNPRIEDIKIENGANAEKRIYEILCKQYSKNNVEWISSNAKKFDAQSNLASSKGGDAAGYDIFYNDNNITKYVEVKSVTTTSDGEWNFIITANEEAKANDPKYKDNYFVYLVAETRYIVLTGEKLKKCLANGYIKDKKCAIKLDEAEALLEDLIV